MSCSSARLRPLLAAERRGQSVGHAVERRLELAEEAAPHRLAAQRIGGSRGIGQRAARTGARQPRQAGDRRSGRRVELELERRQRRRTATATTSVRPSASSAEHSGELALARRAAARAGARVAPAPVPRRRTRGSRPRGRRRMPCPRPSPPRPRDELRQRPRAGARARALAIRRLTSSIERRRPSWAVRSTPCSRPRVARTIASGAQAATASFRRALAPGSPAAGRVAPGLLSSSL